MAYTNIDDPSAYFQIALWTGNGTAGNSVTFDGNSNMQPDIIWSKRRDVGTHHVLKTTSIGGTSNNDNHLVPSLNTLESTYSNYRVDFDSDGFTLDGVGDTGFQGNGTSMVTWAWKLNGGTTSSNTDGYITSTVQANTTSGVSVVTFTTDGNTRTVGHGLGVAPKIVLIKKRSGSGSWLFFTTAVDGTHDYGVLQGTNTFSATSYDLPTSSVFSYNDTNNDTFVAYCFAEKQGFSRFGSYTGNADADGTFVYTGFKPAFIMVKRTDDSGYHWRMYDIKRSAAGGGNPLDKRLNANLYEAEGTHASDFDIDSVSNGFKLRTSSQINVAGTYFFMAFAEQPFMTSTGIPTTAR